MPFSLFSALFDHPLNASFIYQEPNEEIELMLRRHWVTNIPWVFAASLAFIFPLFLPMITSYLNTDILFILPGDVGLGLLLIWYLLVIAFVIEKYLHWYFNIYIVTNLHLVDINFHNMLNRDVLEIKVTDVQGASAKIMGIFGSLFNYGDVLVRTAAEKQLVDFSAVPKPDLVADRINNIRERSNP